METSLLYTLISLFLLVLTLKIFRKGKQKLPPSIFPSLPLIGHLYLLEFPLHRTYHRLSQKLGPIFTLKFGNRRIVVINTPSLVEECFTTNDIVLANRPHFIIKYFGYYENSIVSAPYGEYWRNLRRLATIELFSSARINALQSIRHEEVRIQLQKLYKISQHQFTRVEIREMLAQINFNNVVRMMLGKRFLSEDEDNVEIKKYESLTKQVHRLGGVSNLGDFVPLVRWIYYDGIEEKKLAMLNGKMDVFLQNLIDELRRNKGTDTMIDHLLTLQESQPEYYTDTMIKAFISAMVLAGSDTSAVTIEWAMTALLNHPDKLEKARSEIDNLVGGDRLINESDLPNLPYLQNIISETFRVFPAAPLLVPHEAASDCKIGGYDIPRGTILQVNAWAVHRDPTVWEDPTSFRPERFESCEVGQGRLVPFGLGRRSCPGNVMSHRILGLTIGSLVQGFEWRRIGEDMIDLTEGVGSSMPKATPLEAECKARDVLHKVFN